MCLTVRLSDLSGNQYDRSRFTPWHLPLRSRAGNLVIVGQSLQEGDKVILFLICQLKVAELFLVEVAGIFGWRPARDSFSGVSCLALGQDIARVVKVHYVFEALEVAVVHVGLHEVGRRTHIDVAQCGYLELGVEFGSEPDPPRIGIQLAAIALQPAQKRSDARVVVSLSRRISAIATPVGRIFVVILQLWIPRDAEIAGCEVGEQRFFTGPAIAVTLVASCLTAEQRIPIRFMWRELFFSRLHIVIFGSERTDLRRSFIRGSRQSEAVIHAVGTLPVCHAEMDRVVWSIWRSVSASMRSISATTLATSWSKPGGIWPRRS